MKLETIRQITTEVQLSGNGVDVTCYQWANGEGTCCIVHNTEDSMAQRTAFSLRWEELDVLLVALTAARSS